MTEPPPAAPPDWERGDRILELRSRWFTLIGEHWRDHQGQDLEYWRVERAHSVIVLPIHADHILLPPPAYRPGIAAPTYDFPGGRLPDDITPEAATRAILKRELGVDPSAIAHLTPLNPDGWVINSSFSNQRLYGWVADLRTPTATPPATWTIAQRHPTTAIGVRTLLNRLTCLQCRAILLDWWTLHTQPSPAPQNQ